MIVPNERRYQLHSEEANSRIDALLEQLKVPADTRQYYAQMLTTVLKLYEDGADVGDLKITNAALKDLRYAFKVFAPYRGTRKVTVFGSARTGAEDPISVQARAFGRRMVEAGWMVVTGAGDGVMGAAQEGAGRERSFGLNIRLPFEQEANPWIADDAKLINFKYFFIRKLFLLKEADAVALFPGGFGTFDEAFEVLTLIQTGKTPVIPVVLLDAPGGEYWRAWERLLGEQMVGRGLISQDDESLFRIVDSVEAGAGEILGFYRNFHSMRFVGEALALRINRPLPPERLSDLGREFSDILDGPLEQRRGPLPAEGDELPEFPRLVVPFGRARFGRLRRLIDAINSQRPVVSVLVVCTGNSARSQMAEGFLGAYGQGRVEALSAGTEPKGLNPHAVAVMAEKGIDISGHASKPFDEAVAERMDYVITVCGDAESRCPALSPSVRRLHWPLADPAGVTGDERAVRAAFLISRDEIERLVRTFLDSLG